MPSSSVNYGEDTRLNRLFCDIFSFSLLGIFLGTAISPFFKHKMLEIYK
jgi:hypothetical protein